MRLSPVNNMGVYSLTKVRVYELAKELGISNKELVNKLNELDIKVGNHMSSIEAEEAELVKEFISSEEEEKDNLHEESSDINKKKKSSNTKPKKANDADKKANTSKKNHQPEKKSGEESNVNINVNIIEVGNKIQVKDLAEKINISPNKLISKLINFGVMAGINQEIDFDTASIIASEFNYELRLDKKQTRKKVRTNHMIV